MKWLNSASAYALVAGSLLAAPYASAQQAAPPAGASQIDTIIITAQKREENLQDAPLAVSAVSGEGLEEARIQNFSDLALSIPSLSYSENSPLDQEFNIRGVTNTRLDAPTADQSVGIFSDEIYVGRSGLVNTDFYDIARVEVIRGPQGVLLGRNVAGGAISVFTAEPSREAGGRFLASYGNYDLTQTSGHVTGALTDALAGRLSFQSRQHSGYNKDILNNRDLDDLQSFQARGQLLFAPEDGGFTARLIGEYMKDTSNGIHRVAIANPNLTGSKPWSATRAAVRAARGYLDIRESLPEHPLYAGDRSPTTQRLQRESWGLTLLVEKELTDTISLASVTGHREGQGFSLYDQSGIGPDSGYGVISPFAFSFPVNEIEGIKQTSQEFRLTSNHGDASRWDWIAGAYFQTDEIDKFDRYWGEIPLTAVGTISGQSHWLNKGGTDSYAGFGQLSYEFTDDLKLTAGVRYTHDEKSGVVSGIIVATGDKFSPTNAVPLTPLTVPFSNVAYSASWSEVTPQAILEYQAFDDLLLYASYGKGYKGGGFEDTPANAAAAQSSFDPETVDSIEAGVKWDFWDRRARLNVAAFSMDYQNMQVTQTSASCLCNITDNAAAAEIKGVEAEFQVKPTDWLYLWGGGSLLDTKYIDFVDTLGVDNSGNFLQRTPDYQVNIGVEVTSPLGAWDDALKFRVEYSHQGEQFWLPDNLNREAPYGLLDGRISLQVPDRDWTFSIWGKNLTDEIYRTNIIAFFGDEVSTLGPPLTFGVEFSTDF